MLTLIIGRAGTGKTARVMNDIKSKMEAGETDLYLLVPEQYSHDAERQLCSVCGDRLSMHGEALSFTQLCSRVFSETGGTAVKSLDAGGQILAMRRALETAAPDLRTFGNKGLRAELLEKLLAAAREFKSHGITPEKLGELSDLSEKPLSDKLADLSLIFGAYDAFFGENAADPSGRLDRLADAIGQSSFGDKGHIYFDGFNDFTAQEMRVIAELLKKNADMTVCLTFDRDDGSEAFELPRKTAERLIRLAGEYGVRAEEAPPAEEQETRAEELSFLERNLFGSGTEGYPDKCRAIEVYTAPNVYTECEYAAHKVLELVRSGLRWRDVGVMARDFSEYSVCESVFEKYGVRFFWGGRADILQKPPAALIDAALETVTSGWQYKPVFRYLKTDLTGVPASQCAELENYVLKWGIRGSMWTQNWTLPPSGYDNTAVSEDAALIRLNELRETVTKPLLNLYSGVKGVSGADVKLRALYGFFEDIALPERLSDRAELLRERGELRLADEYEQLWDAIKSAMEQFEILGGTLISASEFRKLFILALSQYDVGVIPVSLDRTMLGGMAMSRRRDLKCLILLGATDECLPALTSGGGLLSPAERDELARFCADIPAGREERLAREMNMIYSTLTLPSQKLIITYPAESRPSFIVKRILKMFGITALKLREEEYMTAAETPCRELAMLYGNNSSEAAAARKYFSDDTGGIVPLYMPVRAKRRGLSPDMAAMLYGRESGMSASRVERYYECAFAHFLQNGLKLVPRVPAGFDAPAAGTFTHYVLENVSREISRTAGFKNADTELCNELTNRFINEYVHNELYDFEGRDGRFRFLFNRLAGETLRIIPEMMDELKNSDFEPLDFELNLAELAGSGAGRPRGIADRVDGWRSGGKLYLRIVDYKTGKKPFRLSDILRGMGMQMLIYLFALEKYGKSRYGADIIPAGVLYVPAREVIIKTSRNTSDSEIEKLRGKQLRRGGLVLCEDEVLRAMENGDTKKYLPVKLTKDGYTGDGAVSRKQFKLLAGHIGAMLKGAERGIFNGRTVCEPYFKNDADNACIYCHYHAVCTFSEELGDRRRYITSLSADEVWEALEGGVTDERR